MSKPPFRFGEFRRGDSPDRTASLTGKAFGNAGLPGTLRNKWSDKMSEFNEG
jgi:hypothetical protein